MNVANSDTVQNPNTVGSSLTFCPGRGPHPHGWAPAAADLDQEREKWIGFQEVQENKPFSDVLPHDWREHVQPGQCVLLAARSGGPHDWLGCRGKDVARVDDLRELVAHCPGRWVMLTLTVDRSNWLDPHSCYQRVGGRVRRVAEIIARTGVWFCSLEMQSKTGDGWPHWHLLIWCPDDRTISELHALVVKHWVIREPLSHDPETGEVLQWGTLPLANPKALHVAECRTNLGAAVYAAKYITKPWHAIPRWMLESTRQYRKLRCSDKVFEILERLHRHARTRRHTDHPTSGRRRGPARILGERIACSGASVNVFKVGQAGKLEFAGTLPIDIQDTPAAVKRAGGGAVRVGKWRSVRWVVSGGVVARLRADRERWRRAAAVRLQERRERIWAAWDRQHEAPFSDEEVESWPSL